ncbi:MAG: thiamine biosynthesis protein ThiF [Anaerolineae bacterium]|nr:thiamine biosynthesis protein ThiF [Thermoplasmata archaeon]NIV32264.1 thiamine biosynthesis protein ThiF [Anaerolineae bacterium]NIY03717.1 thiamine biosynthesis protein ThiF [Thermoplasmata archaeon]
MKTVVVVGAGALGSHLVLLARNWEVDLQLVDFDRVEAKNIQSQFHSKMGSGKNKAKALQSLMNGLFGLKVGTKPVKLADNNQQQLLGAADLIIDCTDNFAAREIIQGFAREHEVACLHGCLSADGDLARVVWTEHFTADAEGEEGEATCEDGRNLAFHALAAAMIAQVAQKFLEEDAKQSWQVTPFTVVRLT